MEESLGPFFEWLTSDPVLPWAFLLGKVLGYFGLIFGAVAPVMIWVERKTCALIQDRIGPNRVGPIGLLQSLADGVKLVFKEDLRPQGIHPLLFILAPILTVIPAAMAFAVIPFGPSTTVGGLFEEPQRMQIANLNVGFLYILAITSLGVYGIAIAGWASNNKFSVLGSLRAAAQMISYELAVGLSILSIVLWAGSVDLVSIVEAQNSVWFILPAILAFLVFLPGIFAETNRTPFDLPEAEAELVVGYHTEYSGIKFGLFFLAEYANMATASALCVCLFFGGWELPFIRWADLGINMDASLFDYVAVAGVVGEVFKLIPVALLGTVVFAAKVAFFLFLFVWVRWTLPRFRYDQLMGLGWKTLLPIALVNVCLTAGWIAFAR